MMIKYVKYAFSLLVFLSVSSGLQAQDEIVYQHPALGIQFSASPNWKHVVHSGENMTYELVNQNNNMLMKMWFVKTEKPVIEYLRSEVCKEGMVDDRPFITDIDEQVAYGIGAICSEMRRPFKVMLIAMPTEDGLYLFKFKCPEECYAEHQKQIQELLETISFGPVVERTVYYADNNL
jgi:hypothetical protein